MYKSKILVRRKFDYINQWEEKKKGGNKFLKFSGEAKGGGHNF